MLTSSAIVADALAEGGSVGPANRLVLAPNGSYYLAVIETGGVIELRKFTDIKSLTTYSGSGEHTVLSQTGRSELLTCEVTSDGILHLLFTTVDGGTRKVLHKQFDTSDDSWVSGETTVSSGGSTSLGTGEGLACIVGRDDTLHLAWWMKDSNYELHYNSYDGSSWGTEADLTTSQSDDPLFSLRIDVDDSGRVLILSDDGLGQWKAWEFDSSWTGTNISGVGQCVLVHDGFNVFHVAFLGDRRHTTIPAGVAGLSSTLGAFEYHYPHVAMNSSSITDGSTLPAGLYIENEFHFLTINDHGIHQGKYSKDVWNEHAHMGGHAFPDGDTVFSTCYHSDGDPFVVATLHVDEAFWYLFTFDRDEPHKGGKTHDFTIDGKGYMLASNLQKAGISQALPRVSLASDQRKEDDFSDLTSFTQSSWHHGRGEIELSDPNAFFDAAGVFTHVNDQVTSSFYPNATTRSDTSGTDFQGTPRAWALYAGNLYMLIYGSAASNNKLFVWDNTNTEWDVVSAGLDTSTGEPLGLEIVDDDLWVAQGESVNARVYDASGASWTSAQAPATAFKFWDGLLWRGDNLNEIYYSSDYGSPGSETWTLLGIASTGAGTANRVMKFEPYGGALLVFMQDAVWQIIANGDGTYQLIELINHQADQSPYNAYGTANFGGVMYYSLANRVIRFDGSTIQEVGPDRSGLPSLKFHPRLERGIIWAMHPSSNLLYAAFGSGVLVYNGIGWHEFHRGGTITSCFHTPTLASTGTLSHANLWHDDYVSSEYRVYWERLPSNSAGDYQEFTNPLRDSSVVYQATDPDMAADFVYRLITGWQDKGLPSLEKVIHEIFVRCDGLGDAATDWKLDVYFQTEDGTDSFTLTDWTYLCTFTQDGEDSIDITAFTDRTSDLDTQGAVGGLTYKRIRYLLDFREPTGSTTTTPFVLRGFTERFAVRTEDRYGFTAVVKAFDDLVRLDGGLETRDGETLRQEIYKLQTRVGHHHVDDGTLLGAINQMTNSSFERDSDADGLADDLSIGGTAGSTAYSLNSKHKTSGRYSQYVSLDTAATLLGPIITMPAGVSIKVGLSIYLTSGTGARVTVYETDVSGVVQSTLGISDVVANQEPAESPEFVEVQMTMDSKLSSPGYIRIEVASATSSALVLYTDSWYVYFGSNTPDYYFDGDSPRAQWHDDDPYLGRSLQRSFYSAYVTGQNESFRFRTAKSKAPTKETHITLFLREASG